MSSSLRFRRSLAARLLQIAGVTAAAVPAAYAAGCGGEAVLERGGTDGVGGASSATSTNSTTTTNTSTSVSTTNVTSSDAVTAVSVTVTTAVSTGSTPTEVECIPISPDGTCPTDTEALAILQTDDCTDPDYEWTTAILDGPFSNEQGDCCYVVQKDYCGVGRPYVAAGGQVVAPVRRTSSDWIAGDAAPEVAHLSDAERGSLARAWAQDGMLEHASVASFARASLDLLAAGAPAELVAATHEAALDEVRHTKLCLALARAYGAADVAPGRFPLGGTVRVAESLAELARATVIEGCAGETIAALLASEELSRSTDPAVRAVLSVIADDEARHAELAWRTVAWAIATGGDDVRDAVLAAFEEARGALDHPPQHGRLSPAIVREAVARGFAEVVEPAVRALLGRDASLPGGPRAVALA